MKKIFLLLFTIFCLLNINSVKAELIYTCDDLAPNYKPGTTIKVDLKNRIIKLSEPTVGQEYYNIETIYGHLIISSEVKNIPGITEDELKEIKMAIKTEIRIVTKVNAVGITWQLIEGGSGVLYDYFKDKFDKGEKKQNINTKCKFKNLYSQSEFESLAATLGLALD